MAKLMAASLEEGSSRISGGHQHVLTHSTSAPAPVTSLLCSDAVPKDSPEFPINASENGFRNGENFGVAVKDGFANIPIVQNGHNNDSSGFDVERDDESTFSDPSSQARWKPFLIGVAGGTASGKTSVCHKIMCKLGQNHLEHHQRRVVTISSDSFYRVLNTEERERARIGEYNFDHPDALDYQLILDTMDTLLRGKTAQVPLYDFVTHSRFSDQHLQVFPADVILFEGILIFYFPDLRNLFQLKLFVDMDADTRLARRVVRDLKDRGRDLPSVIHQYTLFVKPAFEEFCQPTKKYADVIIPRGAENEVAIDLIVQHIKEHLLPLASENGSPRRYSQDDVSDLA